VAPADLKPSEAICDSGADFLQPLPLVGMIANHFFASSSMSNSLLLQIFFTPQVVAGGEFRFGLRLSGQVFFSLPNRNSVRMALR